MKSNKQWSVVEYSYPQSFEIRRTVGFRAGLRVVEHMKAEDGTRLSFTCREQAQKALDASKKV